MQAILRAFSLPKEGSSPAENEDAWACSAAEAPSLGALRLALADGASETSFARLWAKMLARAYAQGAWDGTPPAAKALEILRRRWSLAVSRRPLPWHAEEKVRQGAYATFLGLLLDLPQEGTAAWQAVAIGDSCLVHLRLGEPLRIFPAGSREDLPSRPEALSSLPGDRADLLFASGRAEAGDRLLLMTDALARWCLGRKDRGGRPWRPLCRLEDTGPEAFARFIAARRTAGDLRNDDVTLLSISLVEGPPCCRS